MRRLGLRREVSSPGLTLPPTLPRDDEDEVEISARRSRSRWLAFDRRRQSPVLTTLSSNGSSDSGCARLVEGRGLSASSSCPSLRRQTNHGVNAYPLAQHSVDASASDRRIEVEEDLLAIVERAVFGLDEDAHLVERSRQSESALVNDLGMVATASCVTSPVLVTQCLTWDGVLDVASEVTMSLVWRSEEALPQELLEGSTCHIEGGIDSCLELCAWQPPLPVPRCPSKCSSQPSQIANLPIKPRLPERPQSAAQLRAHRSSYRYRGEPSAKGAKSALWSRPTTAGELTYRSSAGRGDTNPFAWTAPGRLNEPPRLPPPPRLPAAPPLPPLPPAIDVVDEVTRQIDLPSDDAIRRAALEIPYVPNLSPPPLMKWRQRPKTAHTIEQTQRQDRGGLVGLHVSPSADPTPRVSEGLALAIASGGPIKEKLFSDLAMSFASLEVF